MTESSNHEPENSKNTPSDSETPTEQPFDKKKWIIENVLSLALAIFIVLIIRSSVIEAFKIPSGSMIPTLLIGDHIFVNKFAYGLKIPFTGSKIPFTDVDIDPIYLIKRDPPKRGDIIVFLYPKNEELYYIKRVVGVPGDILEVRNKELFINNKPVGRIPVEGEKAEKIYKELDDPRYTPSNIDFFMERLDQTDHFIFLDKSTYMTENHGPVKIPEESLFVMGDNRDSSNDSRFWGFVPYRNVKGKAMVIWLSVWFSEPFAFRLNRIGTILH